MNVERSISALHYHGVLAPFWFYRHGTSSCLPQSPHLLLTAFKRSMHVLLNPFFDISDLRGAEAAARLVFCLVLGGCWKLLCEVRIDCIDWLVASFRDLKLVWRCPEAHHCCCCSFCSIVSFSGARVLRFSASISHLLSGSLRHGSRRTLLLPPRLADARAHLRLRLSGSHTRTATRIFSILKNNANFFEDTTTSLPVVICGCAQACFSMYRFADGLASRGFPLTIDD